MIAKPTWVTAGGALKYHKESQDNYYQQEGDLGVWQGEAAERLGLTGAVKEKDLENVLWGKDREGNELVQARMDENGDRKRAGLDLTFNAPKSVSIALELAMANGDDELARAIIDTHNEVVNNKLESFEKMLQSRETVDGETKVITTGNMAAAKFTHFTARPVEHDDGSVTVDPQLHTHAVVMNMTQHENGEWHAIESKAIYNNYMALGKEYRVDFAAKLSERFGYNINITNQNDALFEISLTGNMDKDKEIIEGMSFRSKEIKETAEQLKEEMKNASESELKQHAAWQSRTWKDGEVDRQAMLQQNLERAKELGLTPQMIQKSDRELESIDENMSREDKIKVHLQNALEVLEENTSVFNTHDLLSTAGALGMRDSIKTEEFRPYMKESKELVSLDKGNYTTKTILKNENELIEAIKDTNAQKAFNRTHTIREVKEQLREYNQGMEEAGKHKLNAGQQKSIELILSSKEQIIGIQGDAGTGKTTMLKALNTLKDENTKIIGLSYTGKAAQEIEIKTAEDKDVRKEAEKMAKSSEVLEQSGIKSRTVSSFLAGIESEKINKEDYKDSIIIVDESSFLGTKDATRLTNFAKESGAKIVYMGDEKQMKAMTAGDPFRLAKHHADMKTANMNEAIRQKTIDLKHTVSLLNDYKAIDALEYMDKKGMVKELEISEDVEDKKEALRVAAVESLKASYFDNSKNQLMVGSKEIAVDPLIFTSTNKTKDMINDAIHAERVNREEITELQDTTARATTNLRPSQKLLAESYVEGHDIAFLKEDIKLSEELTLEKGQEFRVVAPSKEQIEKNTLTLKDEKDKEHTINLTEHGSKLETFYEKELEVGEGSKIAFTKNDRKIGVQNGATAIIKSIDDQQVTAKLTESGKTVSFNLNNYQYIDHGYALTTHKSQGQTSERVIAFLDSNMQDYSSFYVAVTRAEKHLEIVTDDKEQLSTMIQSENLKYNATTYYEQLRQEEKEYLEREESRAYNSPATEKQNAVVEKMAKWLDIEEAPKFEKFGEAREWIDEHMEDFKGKLEEYEQKLEGPATEKQTDLVAKIAKSLRMEEEPKIESYKEAKEFINKHIDQYGKNIEEYIKKLEGPPTEKQVQLMQSITNTLGVERGEDEGELTYGAAKKFINEHIEKYQDIKLAQRTERITQELGIEPPTDASKEELKAWVDAHKDEKSEFRNTIKELAEIRLEQAVEKQEELSTKISSFKEIKSELDEFKSHKQEIKENISELYKELRSAESEEQKVEVQTKIEELKTERQELQNPLDKRIEADKDNKELKQFKYTEQEISRAEGLIDKADKAGKPIFDSDVRFLINHVGTKEGYKNFDAHFESIDTRAVEFELPGIKFKDEEQNEEERDNKTASEIASEIRKVAEQQFKDEQITKEEKERAGKFASFIEKGADQIAVKPLINKGLTEEQIKERWNVEQIKQEAAALDFGAIANSKEAKESFVTLLKSNNELQKDERKAKYSTKMLNHFLEKEQVQPKEIESKNETSELQQDKEAKQTPKPQAPKNQSKPQYRIPQEEIQRAWELSDLEMKTADPAPVLDGLGIEYRLNGNRYEFKAREERTASANIYLHKSGEWRYKDFGAERGGNVAHLARDVLNTNYKEARQYVIGQLGTRDYVSELLEDVKSAKEAKISESDIQAAKERMQEAAKSGRVADRESKVLEVLPINFEDEKVQDFLKSRNFKAEKMPEWAVYIRGEYRDRNGKMRQQEGIGVEGDNGSGDIHYLKPIVLKDGTELKTMSFGNKDITKLEPVEENEKKSVVVFESKNDAIAEYHQNPQKLDSSTVIIANGTAQVDKVAEVLREGEFEDITIYNQNDSAGEKFKDQLIEKAELQEWKEVEYQEGEWKKDINDLHKDGVQTEDRLTEKSIESALKDEVAKQLESGEIEEAAKNLNTNIEQIETDEELKELEERFERKDEEVEQQEVELANVDMEQENEELAIIDVEEETEEQTEEEIEDDELEEEFEEEIEQEQEQEQQMEAE
jgi:conjugative relaxase-like TrwC/TraI family protein